MESYQLITVLGPTAWQNIFCRSTGCPSRFGDYQCRFAPDLSFNGFGTGKDLANYTTVNGKRYLIIWLTFAIRVISTMYSNINMPFPGIRGYPHNRGENYLSFAEVMGYIEAVLKGYKLLMFLPTGFAWIIEGEVVCRTWAAAFSYKTLHNKTDVDSPQRAIRAIEIEEY